MAAKSPRVPTSPPPPGGFGLGDLLAAQGLRSSAPVEEPAPAAVAPPARVVVRVERKGRGGKTVTTLTRHALGPIDAAALAQRLRRALGCGSSVEGEVIALQGDQREAAERLLTAEGWRVTLG